MLDLRRYYTLTSNLFNAATRKPGLKMAVKGGGPFKEVAALGR